MKSKLRVLSALIVVAGLVIGWNLQNQQVAEALLGANTYVSRSTTGGTGNGQSHGQSISHDGRYVVFSSNATNLVPSDTNAQTDVFLRDTLTNAITLVSVDSSGNQGNGLSSLPTISGDARFIVYSSTATNLVANDTNATGDVFRYNVATGVTERVSVDSSGNQANDESYRADTDTEGRFVVFVTKSTNLAAVTDSNSAWDVVLKDMNTGTVKYVSQSDTGTVGNSNSGNPKISCNGRFIVFSSGASNLVTGDTNGWADIFLTDMLVTQTVANVTPGANSWSEGPDISCDGNYLSFTSRATNFGVKPSTGANTYDVYRYNRTTAAIDAVSSRQDGSAPTGSSVYSVISSDGRYVVYSSSASDMITPGTDQNIGQDLFLRDMNTTGFRIVNQTPSGTNGNYATRDAASFSGTNRIAFSSSATNLVSGVSDNSNPDVFITDVGTPNTCTF